jgi:hypothetical protein
MIEPWVTPWSRFVYNLLHHEPFDPETPSWNFQLAVRFPGQMMRCRGLSSPEIGRNLSKSFLNGGLKQSSRLCLSDIWFRAESLCVVLHLLGASGCGDRLKTRSATGAVNWPCLRTLYCGGWINPERSYI